MHTFLMVTGTYIGVAIVLWLGPAFVPKFHKWLWNKFDGDFPDPPYEVIIFLWPIMLPCLMIGYFLYTVGLLINVIHLSNLDEVIVKYMENRNKPKAAEIKKLPEPKPVMELGYRDSNCISCGRSMKEIQ